MKINGKEIATMDPYTIDGYYFSYLGCDNCNNSLGCDVMDAKLYLTTKCGDIDVSDWYSIRVCAECLNTYYNGDELGETCQNIFEI